MKILKESVYVSKITFTKLFKKTNKKNKSINKTKFKVKKPIIKVEEVEELMDEEQIEKLKRDKIIEEFIKKIPKNKSKCLKLIIKNLKLKRKLKGQCYIQMHGLRYLFKKRKESMDVELDFNRI